MKVWVVMSVRNEEDIIRYTMEHWMTQGVAGIMVANNLSEDRTPLILKDIQQNKPKEIQFEIIEDNDPAWYQSKKITSMAHKAFDLGADFIIPCDADELWYSHEKHTVAGSLSGAGGDVVGVPMWNHWQTGLDDSSNPNPFTRMKWRDSNRNALDKACYKYKKEYIVDDGNHRIMLNGTPVPGVACGIGIRHFPYRGGAHFVTKSVVGARALWAAKDLSPSVGAHWRGYAETVERAGPQALVEHYLKWFYHPDPARDGLVLDPAPYKRT